MTAAYAPHGLSRCVRGIAFVAGFQQLIVVDEFAFTASPPSNITWAMHTKAQVDANGTTARLTQGEAGQTLYASVSAGSSQRGTTAEEVSFGTVDVDLKKPQNPSPGLRKLVVQTTPANAGGRLVVSLSLDQHAKPVHVNALSDWAMDGPVKKQ